MKRTVPVKVKVSVTIDEPLIAFLDGLAGESRSAKLEGVLRSYRAAVEDLALRQALAAEQGTAEAPDGTGRAWERALEAAQWSR